MSEPNTQHQQDHDSIKAWFARWSEHVAGVDMQGARALFSPQVIGFGTYKDFVDGLDALCDGQWSTIWPTIADFQFRLETLRTDLSPDRLMAVGMILWTSTGIDQNDKRYPRPGRASVTLRRAKIDDPWLGYHTHLSLYPREQKLSFGGPSGSESMTSDR